MERRSRETQLLAMALVDDGSKAGRGRGKTCFFFGFLKGGFRGVSNEVERRGLIREFIIVESDVRRLQKGLYFASGSMQQVLREGASV